jgi:hypothetical protein
MESRCHQGKKRLYDTVTRYGWSQDVRTHRIGVIIDRLLSSDWEEGRGVPAETEDGDDCDVSSFVPIFKAIFLTRYGRLRSVTHGSMTAPQTRRFQTRYHILMFIIHVLSPRG